MSEKNTKLAREWLEEKWPTVKPTVQSLTALLDQKDADWERDVRKVRKDGELEHPGLSEVVCLTCDEILKRRGIKP